MKEARKREVENMELRDLVRLKLDVECSRDFAGNFLEGLFRLKESLKSKGTLDLKVLGTNPVPLATHPLERQPLQEPDRLSEGTETKNHRYW